MKPLIGEYIPERIGEGRDCNCLSVFQNYIQASQVTLFRNCRKYIQGFGVTQFASHFRYVLYVTNAESLISKSTGKCFAAYE